MPEEYLEIRGARVHNLKNIDLRLPHNRLIVVTGVSGSGKTSLVFDIVYAEGRRRYVESLSSYARQFLERMERPDVDEVLGIAPTVAIRQKNTTRNPRSTVATTTEIYDFLRLLFARVGRTHCTQCGQRVMRDDVDSVARAVLALEQGSRWLVLFPARSADSEGESWFHLDPGLGPGQAAKARLGELRERGYNRLFQDGNIFHFSQPESLLDVDFGRELYVLVDRIAIGPDIRERIVDGVEIAYREGGEVRFAHAGELERQMRFSNRFECGACGIEYRPPEPRMFSFNTPLGACKECEGQGQVSAYSMDLIVSRPHLSLRNGAVAPWEGAYLSHKERMLKRAAAVGVPVDIPYRELSPEQRRFVEEGDAYFKGIRGFLAKLESKSWKPHIGAMLARWRQRTVCPQCHGTRFSQQVLHVRVGGASIADVLELSLARAWEFFNRLELDGAEAVIAGNLLVEIQNRLRFLTEVGLEYLTLNRLASTLSGGEAQRIQLASSLGARLAGVCYVLDEPSIGLHSRDTAKLIGILKELRDLGNTIFVVEHDREMMRAADHLVDLGPAAGEQGGEVVFSGPFGQIQTWNGSLTGRYLSGEAEIPVPKARRTRNPTQVLRFKGATKHNLRSLSFEIPLGLLVAVTGVSGSGKSTLMHGIVHRCLRDAIRSGHQLLCLDDLPCDSVDGHGALRDLILVDQASVGRTARSVPATYIGVFDEVRTLFAATKEATLRHYGPSRFSFNLPGGRCETCGGTGKQTVDMQFLADVDLPCEDCGGKRYSPETLEITYRGKTIVEVLEMTIAQALRLFADSPRIVRRLATLAEVGLGYLRLGQPGSQLSGGEAQRMKLALHIAEAQMKDTLFLFDEPTTGLHFDDIHKLLRTFEKLIQNGASVLVIEHNLDVIKCADWILDLGPEGGDGGGQVLAVGPPEQVAKCPESQTARFLREVLA